MKGHSLNFIPSLEDISILNRDSVYMPNQMELIVSKKQFGSCKSIQRFIIGNPLEQLHDQVSISHQRPKSFHNLEKQIPLGTKECFKTPKKKKTGCLCKKIDCRKLYCECFKNGKACTEDCACSNCENIERNCEENTLIRTSKKNRCKHSHDSRKTCNCKKTKCLKKYCECYNAGLPCLPECKCNDCHN